MSSNAGPSEVSKAVSAGVVYRTVILCALLGALEDPLPRNWRIIVTVFLSLQAITMANAYARVLSRDISQQRVTPWREVGRSLLLPDWSNVGLLVPICFFALASAGLLSQPAAMLASKAGLIALLFIFGFLARRRSGASVARSLQSGVLGAAVGYLVIQIKVWTKYIPVVGV